MYLSLCLLVCFLRLQMTAYLNNTNFFAVEVSKISAQILFLSTSDLTAHEVGNVQLPSVEHLGIREKRKVLIKAVG